MCLVRVTNATALFRSPTRKHFFTFRPDRQQEIHHKTINHRRLQATVKALSN